MGQLITRNINKDFTGLFEKTEQDKRIEHHWTTKGWKCTMPIDPIVACHLNKRKRPSRKPPTDTNNVPNGNLFDQQTSDIGDDNNDEEEEDYLDAKESIPVETLEVKTYAGWVICLLQLWIYKQELRLFTRACNPTSFEIEKFHYTLLLHNFLAFLAVILLIFLWIFFLLVEGIAKCLPFLYFCEIVHGFSILFVHSTFPPPEHSRKINNLIVPRFVKGAKQILWASGSFLIRLGVVILVCVLTLSILWTIFKLFGLSGAFSSVLNPFSTPALTGVDLTKLNLNPMTHFPHDQESSPEKRMGITLSYVLDSASFDIFSDVPPGFGTACRTLDDMEIMKGKTNYGSSIPLMLEAMCGVLHRRSENCLSRSSLSSSSITPRITNASFLVDLFLEETGRPKRNEDPHVAEEIFITRSDANTQSITTPAGKIVNFAEVRVKGWKTQGSHNAYYSLEDVCIITYKDENGICYHYLNPEHAKSATLHTVRSTLSASGSIIPTTSMASWNVIKPTIRNTVDGTDEGLDTTTTTTLDLNINNNDVHENNKILSKLSSSFWRTVSAIGDTMVSGEQQQKQKQTENQNTKHSQGESKLSSSVSLNSDTLKDHTEQTKTQNTDTFFSSTIDYFLPENVRSAISNAATLTTKNIGGINGKKEMNNNNGNQGTSYDVFRIEIESTTFPFLEVHEYVTENPCIIRYQPLIDDMYIIATIDLKSDTMRMIEQHIKRIDVPDDDKDLMTIEKREEIETSLIRLEQEYNQTKNEIMEILQQREIDIRRALRPTNDINGLWAITLPQRTRVAMDGEKSRALHISIACDINYGEYFSKEVFMKIIDEEQYK